MKKIKFFLYALIVLLIGAACAWAEDAAPTAMSNKEAIDLVQTHKSEDCRIVSIYGTQVGKRMEAQRNR